jgi:carbon-monoxide dehydrogenase medium subunit
MRTEAYLFPRTIEECLVMLSRYQGEACVMAGGTDFMLGLNEKKFQVKAIVDITMILDLQVLEFTADALIIGAGVTHAQVALHPRIRKCLPVLADACASVGSPQIRNIATLAGNIVSARPAADAAISLVALGAQVEISSPRGKRAELVENLYAGVGKSKIDSTGELLIRIIVPLPGPQGGTAFTRFAPREALALPIVNAAAYVGTDGARIVQARIAIGPVATHPFRPLQAEQNLVGMKTDDYKGLEEVAHTASKEANPRDSLLRGSCEYRRALVKDLVARALLAAVKNAIGG